MPLWKRFEKLSDVHHFSVTVVFCLGHILHDFTNRVLHSIVSFITQRGVSRRFLRGVSHRVVSKEIKWWLTSNLRFRDVKLPLRHCGREFWLIVVDLDD